MVKLFHALGSEVELVIKSYGGVVNGRMWAIRNTRVVTRGGLVTQLDPGWFLLRRSLHSHCEVWMSIVKGLNVRRELRRTPRGETQVGMALGADLVCHENQPDLAPSMLQVACCTGRGIGLVLLMLCTSVTRLACR